MNFQAARQANGGKIVMNAIADRIDGITFTPTGTAKQGCKFTDANGEQQKVTIWQGNGEPIPENLQGQALSINISCKQSGKYTNYGGFWNSEAQVAPLTPQKPQQAPSQATGSSKKAEVDWDAIAEGKVRTVLVGNAIASGQVKIKNVTDLTYWVGYCMTGRAPLPPSKIPNPHPDITEPPPTGDEEP